mmetsp:Transcript_127176/g.368185  ORF Transcript_127176/g.368185 Transcript_127176/m.368185 type:complete len:429 (+) Transcript_127176:95-1381(+)
MPRMSRAVAARGADAAGESDEDDGGYAGRPGNWNADHDQARDGKWWHVPDQQIEAMVHGMAASASVSTSSTARPPEARVAPKRSVRFEEGLAGDALDNLMRRTFERGTARADDGASAPDEDGGYSDDDGHEPGTQRPKRWWRVSNQQLRRKIEQMATESSAPRQASLANASGPLFKDRASNKSARLRSDEKIAIKVFFVESGDTLVMRVSPELHLGPSKPPPSNPFTDLFGQGASTKGFDMPMRGFDYRRREFGSTRRPGWSPNWSDSLKEMIAKVTGIEPARQRLTQRNAPMSIDEMSLRSYGLVDGDILHMRIVRMHTDGQGSRGTTTLACTRRKLESEDRRQQPSAAGSNFSLRDNAELAKCKADSDVWLMPRWVSQANPQLFAPVGISVDGKGGQRARANFAEAPIYLADRINSHIQSVRERVG